MPLLASESDAMLDYEGGRLGYLSIHTADPGATGANESTGAGYARQAITWNPSSGGVKLGQELSFTPNDASSTSYGWGGYWSAATGGTFRGSFQFSAAKTLAAGDTVKVTPKLTETLS